jgi:predicted hydrocarbon binding protein
VHGLIFASLRDYTAVRLGEARAAELWADRVFEMTVAYDDRWFAAQLERLVTATGESMDEVQRGFGSFAAQSTFTGLYPAYYEQSADTFRFLLGIEEKIHEQVRTAIPGASPPRLHVKRLNETGVLIAYTSERGLCRLLEGLVLGAAEHYGETIIVEEIQCIRHGDPGCVFSVMRP